jgi:hypothetical protein
MGMDIAHTEHVTRNAILGLLSNEEIASVSTAETARRLNAGDEYLDLEHLELGVQRARGDVSSTANVLPKNAVSDETWQRILSQLVAPLE